MSLSLFFDKLPRGPHALTAATWKKVARITAQAVLPKGRRFEASVAFLSASAMRELNHTYRGKNKPTNVLSFPQHAAAELKKMLKAPARRGNLYLGDVLICMDVLRTEAREQKKPLNHHLMHLVVHGLLHLLGFDHMDDTQAQVMERLERRILGALGLPDPYTPREPAPKRRPRRGTGRTKKQ